MQISFVTPVFNREDCIVRCIESVQNQEFIDLEHIIIDDNSTDSTLKILECYKEKYPSIKIYQNKKNYGPHYSFMKGVQLAKGDYIIRVDSDDRLSENAILVITQYIKKFPENKYFLFVADDRIKEASLILQGCKYVKLFFEDFLSERVTGDFLHVIRKDVLSDFIGEDDFETYKNLRANEGFNFLRFYKNANTVILINKILYIRERNRKDAVTNEYHLDNMAAIERKFYSLMLITKHFKEDYAKHSLNKIINKKLNLLYTLGLILGKYNHIKVYNSDKNILLTKKIIYYTRTGFLLRLIIVTLIKLKHTINN